MIPVVVIQLFPNLIIMEPVVVKSDSTLGSFELAHVKQKKHARKLYHDKRIVICFSWMSQSSLTFSSLILHLGTNGNYGLVC